MQAFVQNHPAARGGGTSENPTLLPTVHGEGTAPRSRRHWAPPRAEAGGWPGGGPAETGHHRAGEGRLGGVLDTHLWGLQGAWGSQLLRWRQICEGEGQGGPGAQGPLAGRGLPAPSPRRQLVAGGPELLSSLSTKGGSGAGREPTRPLVLSQTKAATLDSEAGCWGSGALPGVAAGRVGPGQVGCQASGLGMGGAEDWVLLGPLSSARNSVRALCLNLEGPSRKPGSWRQRPGGGGRPGGWGSLSRRSPRSPPSHWVPSSQAWLSGALRGQAAKGLGVLGARGAGVGQPGPHLLSPRKVSGQSVTRDPECPLCP